MHEMGIATQIIKIAEAAIPADLENPRVARINLRIGKLSAVVPESLRFCFEFAGKDTLLEGAEIVIEEIPVVAQCNQCDSKWTITGPVFKCQECQSGDIKVLSGRELDVESIELMD